MQNTDTDKFAYLDTVTDWAEAEDAAMLQESLYGLATGLCQQANGSTAPWGLERVEKVRAYLARRVRHWSPPARPEQAVRDAAVLLYVSAALLEELTATRDRG
jgi:hypothetical protein